MENLVLDYVLNKLVDEIDWSYVFKDFEDRFVMGYVLNGIVGKCGLVE